MVKWSEHLINLILSCIDEEITVRIFILLVRRHDTGLLGIGDVQIQFRDIEKFLGIIPSDIDTQKREKYFK